MSNTDVDIMTLNIYVHANTKHVSADCGLKFIDFYNEPTWWSVCFCVLSFISWTNVLRPKHEFFSMCKENKKIKSDTKLVYSKKNLSNQLSNGKRKELYGLIRVRCSVFVEIENINLRLRRKSLCESMKRSMGKYFKEIRWQWVSGS